MATFVPAGWLIGSLNVIVFVFAPVFYIASYAIGSLPERLTNGSVISVLLLSLALLLLLTGWIVIVLSGRLGFPAED